jgi:hypothetical protein
VEENPAFGGGRNSGVLTAWGRGLASLLSTD